VTWLYLFLAVAALVLCALIMIAALLNGIDADEGWFAVLKFSLVVLMPAACVSLLLLTIKLIMEVFS